eukprot:gene1390-4565_t
MSAFPFANIRVIAEASKCPPVSDDVCQVLAADLEYRIREIAQDAAKFTRHGKRRQMTPDDVNAAMRARNMEPIYGYPSGSRVPSVERLFRRAKESDVFYRPDSVKKIQEIISARLPSIPPDITFTSHWLAIEGVQPTIPQNPPGLLMGYRPFNIIKAVQIPTYFHNGYSSKVPKLSDDNEERTVEIKALQKHMLSREQQHLFDYLIKGVIEPNESLRLAALETVAHDPGLHQLVPFFIDFISTQTREKISNPSAIQTAVSIIDALVQNPNIYLEPYLHHVVPIIATCVVTKKLKSMQPAHLNLREHAAQVAVKICSKYSSKYPDIQPRVLRVFQDILKRKRTLFSYYGAIKGLAAFGPRVIYLYLVDILPEAMTLIRLKQREPAFEIVINAIKDAIYEAFNFLVIEKHAAVIEDVENRFANLHSIVPGLELPVNVTSSKDETLLGIEDTVSIAQESRKQCNSMDMKSTALEPQNAVNENNMLTSQPETTRDKDQDTHQHRFEELERKSSIDVLQDKEFNNNQNIADDAAKTVGMISQNSDASDQPLQKQAKLVVEAINAVDHVEEKASQSKPVEVGENTVNNQSGNVSQNKLTEARERAAHEKMAEISKTESQEKALEAGETESHEKMAETNKTESQEKMAETSKTAPQEKAVKTSKTVPQVKPVEAGETAINDQLGNIAQIKDMEAGDSEVQETSTEIRKGTGNDHVSEHKDKVPFDASQMIEPGKGGIVVREAVMDTSGDTDPCQPQHTKMDTEND